MFKKVYLFELDSVRNSEAEIEIGQQALFEELVVNRNQVILSFNQLSDSQVFLAAVRDRRSYEELLKLFKTGALQVSLFGGIRTPSQYMQNSLQKCLSDSKNSFRFSGIPVDQLDKNLINEIKLALQYCDPERLFEVYQDSQKDMERLEYLYRYVKLILLLSEEKTASNPAGNGSRKTLTEFLHTVSDLYNEYSLSDELKQMDTEDHRMTHALSEAFSVLVMSEKMIIEWADDDSRGQSYEEQEKTEKKYLNDRSNWYKALDIWKGTDGVCLAEAIVDLCYNYTIEDSISGISRHYSNLEEDFKKDFVKRLCRYWSDFIRGIHVFHETDRTDCIEFTGKLPDWKMAVRLYDNNRQTEKIFHKKDIIISKIKMLLRRKRNSENSRDEDAEEESKLYERDLTAQRKAWKRLTWGSILARLGFTCCYIVLFILVDCGIDILRNGFDGINVFKLFADSPVFVIVEAFLFGIISSLISDMFGLPDILESIRDIIQYVCDLNAFRYVPKGTAYVRIELIENKHKED